MTDRLITTPNLRQPDNLYQQLTELGNGCDEATSLKRQARLILLLANHIGDSNVIDQAVMIARVIR